MAVYLVGRGIKYHREEIDDVGDIYEVFDGPHPPGGTGYELAEITEIEVLTRETVEAVLASMRPLVDQDPASGKEYWQNPEDDEWYEVVIKPTYDLNLVDFTLGDRAILANELATSEQQIAVLEKIKPNIAKYSINKQTLRPAI